MLGEQGEGYKIGSLVLCRLGKGVKIRTGTELWIPTLEFSKSFGAKVLTFDITGNRKLLNEVVVEISGVTQEEWDSIKGKFLFIDGGDDVVVESALGSVIIIGVGAIYVDGIWVCNADKLKHGYDFRPNDMRLDRDRRLVADHDANKMAAKLWEGLYMRPEKDFCEVVDTMLADGVQDIEYFRYEWCVGLAARTQVANRFRDKFGSDTIAVKTESEVRELQFHSRQACVVESAPLRELLESQLGTIESVRRELGEGIKHRYSTVSLDPIESKNLLLAIEFVSKSTKRSGSTITENITVVDFNSQNTLGMRKDGKIYIGRCALASFDTALKTLVEEVAHEAGADGTHSHVWRIHEIYSDGVALLMEGSFANA